MKYPQHIIRDVRIWDRLPSLNTWLPHYCNSKENTPASQIPPLAYELSSPFIDRDMYFAHCLFPNRDVKITRGGTRRGAFMTAWADRTGLFYTLRERLIGSISFLAPRVMSSVLQQEAQTKFQATTFMTYLMKYPYLLGVVDIGNHKHHVTLVTFFNSYRHLQIELTPFLAYDDQVTSALTSIFGLVPWVILEARLWGKYDDKQPETTSQEWAWIETQVATLDFQTFGWTEWRGLEPAPLWVNIFFFGQITSQRVPRVFPFSATLGDLAWHELENHESVTSVVEVVNSEESSSSGSGDEASEEPKKAEGVVWRTSPERRDGAWWPKAIRVANPLLLTNLFDINFLRRERVYTKLKYSRSPQYDIVSGGVAALSSAFVGTLISEKFGYEMVDSGDFYFAFMYGVFFAFSCRLGFRTARSTVLVEVFSPSVSNKRGPRWGRRIRWTPGTWKRGYQFMRTWLIYILSLGSEGIRRRLGER